MSFLAPEILSCAEPCLLLVDDDPDDVMFFEMALRECARHVEFHHAVDGAEAMKMLESKPGWLPDLILTDLKMAGVDGFELLGLLKNHPTYCKVPAVVFSSSGELVDRERALALGGRAYHVKPLGYQKLVDAVREICWGLVRNQSELAEAARSDVRLSRTEWSEAWVPEVSTLPGSLTALKAVQECGLPFH